MAMNRTVEYSFFFGLLVLVGYFVWKIIAPFAVALALAAIIVTICYPLYTKILAHSPRFNKSIASLVSTLIVLCVVVIPILFVTSLLVNETLQLYNSLNSKTAGVQTNLHELESVIQTYLPDFDLNIAEFARSGATMLSGQLGLIFKGTATTIFLFFIALIGTFYFFRDGTEFTKKLVLISPLPDHDDEVILGRLASSVRSVATGILLIALIQGILTALGLWLFNVPQPILWGAVAAIGATIPGVGTTIVIVPAVIYLVVTGSLGAAIGLGVWGTLLVGLIDNLLGPQLMSRGNTLHPFIILLGVLGGIALFGPVGFIVGPVVISLFMVLIELYSSYMSTNEEKND